MINGQGDKPGIIVQRPEAGALRGSCSTIRHTVASICTAVTSATHTITTTTANATIPISTSTDTTNSHHYHNYYYGYPWQPPLRSDSYEYLRADNSGTENRTDSSTHR